MAMQPDKVLIFPLGIDFSKGGFWQTPDGRMVRPVAEEIENRWRVRDMSIDDLSSELGLTQTGRLLLRDLIRFRVFVVRKKDVKPIFDSKDAITIGLTLSSLVRLGLPLQEGVSQIQTDLAGTTLAWVVREPLLGERMGAIELARYGRIFEKSSPWSALVALKKGK